ncbi:MAG: DUF5615 family PIN-like protein, partial [bacterium]
LVRWLTITTIKKKLIAHVKKIVLNIGKNITPMPTFNPPKIHLNEHLSPRLASQLQKHGFNRTTSQETKLLSQSDEKQLAFAVSQKRALVTFNIRDFSRLHEKYQANGDKHWGIIFSTREPINVLFHRLLRLLNSVSAEELKNQIRGLNEFK